MAAHGSPTFFKNRQRLLEHEVADEFFEAVVRLAKLRRYVSSEHFSVDGTLLKAWASHKSFKPKDGPPSDPPAGRNIEVQWHGEKRRNDTHASTTDPEARLYRKSNNTAATLCYAGHLVSQRIRKRVEEPFGWAKTVAGGRQLRYRGRQRNRAWFKMAAAVYNLIRITALDTQRAIA